jgi:hypothetical protein
MSMANWVFAQYYLAEQVLIGAPCLKQRKPLSTLGTNSINAIPCTTKPPLIMPTIIIIVTSH